MNVKRNMEPDTNEPIAAGPAVGATSSTKMCSMT